MKILQQSFEIMDQLNGDKILRELTEIGYISHATNKDVSTETAEKFLRKFAIELGHESILEFFTIRVKIITDRAIANELVRHRLASYLQRSTRYVKSDNLEVIPPLGIEKNEEAFHYWYTAMLNAEEAYSSMLACGMKAEEARDVLPSCTATEIAMQMNIRTWRNFFYLRYSKFAHPKMIQLAGMLLKQFRKEIPVVFENCTDGTLEEP